MKTLPLITLHILLLGACAAFAAGDTEREFKQLQTEREKAAAAALEPINRRYQTALEALLRRATQSGDLDTALKIRGEIKKPGVTVAGEDAVPNDLRARLLNTTWQWWHAETITFLPGGKARWSIGGPKSFTWKVTNPAQRVIEGTTDKGEKFTLTLDADLTSGTIVEGTSNTRPTALIKGK